MGTWEIFFNQLFKSTKTRKNQEQEKTQEQKKNRKKDIFIFDFSRYDKDNFKRMFLVELASYLGYLKEEYPLEESFSKITLKDVLNKKLTEKITFLKKTDDPFSTDTGLVDTILLSLVSLSILILLFSPLEPFLLFIFSPLLEGLKTFYNDLTTMEKVAVAITGGASLIYLGYMFFKSSAFFKSLKVVLKKLSIPEITLSNEGMEFSEEDFKKHLLLLLKKVKNKEENSTKKEEASKSTQPKEDTQEENSSFFDQSFLIVFDNLDRLSDETTLEAINLIKLTTLTVSERWKDEEKNEEENKEENNIVFIIPMDRERVEKAIAKLFFESVGDKDKATRLVNEFFHKIISIEVNLPTLYFKDWEDFFRKKFEEVFNEGADIREHQIDFIITLFEKTFLHKDEEITPRKIIVFINKLLENYLFWETQKNTKREDKNYSHLLDLRLQALYILLREYFPNDLNQVTLRIKEDLKEENDEEKNYKVGKLLPTNPLILFTKTFFEEGDIGDIFESLNMQFYRKEFYLIFTNEMIKEFKILASEFNSKEDTEKIRAKIYRKISKLVRIFFFISQDSQGKILKEIIKKVKKLKESPTFNDIHFISYIGMFIIIINVAEEINQEKRSLIKRRENKFKQFLKDFIYFLFQPDNYIRVVVFTNIIVLYKDYLKLQKKEEKEKKKFLKLFKEIVEELIKERKMDLKDIIEMIIVSFSSTKVFPLKKGFGRDILRFLFKELSREVEKYEKYIEKIRHPFPIKIEKPPLPDIEYSDYVVESYIVCFYLKKEKISEERAIKVIKNILNTLKIYFQIDEKDKKSILLETHFPYFFLFYILRVEDIKDKLEENSMEKLLLFVDEFITEYFKEYNYNNHWRKNNDFLTYFSHWILISFFIIWLEIDVEKSPSFFKEGKIIKNFFQEEEKSLSSNKHTPIKKKDYYVAYLKDWGNILYDINRLEPFLNKLEKLEKKGIKGGILEDMKNIFQKVKEERDKAKK